ncbi:hypothetical protein V8F33_007709 [Rhypophila sp. PSN 637]
MIAPTSIVRGVTLASCLFAVSSTLSFSLVQVLPNLAAPDKVKCPSWWPEIGQGHSHRQICCTLHSPSTGTHSISELAVLDGQIRTLFFFFTT